MSIQNVYKFYQFVLEVLSRNKNLKSIKGRNSVTNLPKQLQYTQSQPRFWSNSVHFLLEILSAKEMLTYFNSIPNLVKNDT